MQRTKRTAFGCRKVQKHDAEQKKNSSLDNVLAGLQDCWDKLMKEVVHRRMAGPFKDPPFKFYHQSPLGLVPKDGGTKTRLIFDLSYLRGGQCQFSHTQ